jgi:carbonic anhydrase
MMNPATALKRLMSGNQRFAERRALHPHQTLTYRQALVAEQRPFAAVLSCSDSRVPTELIFDQGLGDLFVVRLAGNVIDEIALASLEFAVSQLKISLIVALGHSRCGAVQATIAGGDMPGHLSHLAAAIQPAVDEARARDGDLLDNAVRINARSAAAQMSARSEILAAAARDGQIKIVAGYYDIAAGTVELLSSE